jgi:plastocyanin
MFNSSRAIWPVALLVVALAVAGTGGALAASGEDATVVASEEGGPPGEDELILDFTPSETTVQPGENVTYEVVARGTSLGISAYSDVVVAVEDPEVAEIVDVDANVRGGLDNSEFLDDGALSLGAVLLGNPFPAESNITLATVTVSAAEERNESTTLTYREDARQSFAGPGDVGYEIAETRDASLSVEDLAPADLQISALDPGETTVQPGDAVDLSATVTNEGDREATQTVELTIADTTETRRVTLAGGASETVVFEDVTTGLRPGNYTVTVSTANESTSATLSMSGPPPLANNEPDDLDDDGLYEDVRGDGGVDILDVQELFNSLNTQTLAENAPAFNFQDRDSEVNILDVQALFNQLPDQ